jgi:hypothetical protein
MMSTNDKDSLTTDIIARLRQEGSFPPYYGVPAIQNDAADEIERLRAENERLREALEHYTCDCLIGECEESYYGCGLTARAALEQKS